MVLAGTRLVVVLTYGRAYICYLLMSGIVGAVDCCVVSVGAVAPACIVGQGSGSLSPAGLSDC